MPQDGDVSEVSRDAPALEGLSPEEGVRRDPDRRPGEGAAAAGRAWSLVLAAGLLAGLAGFGIGEAAPTLTPPDLELPQEIRASMRKMRRSSGGWASPGTAPRRWPMGGWGCSWVWPWVWPAAWFGGRRPRRSRRVSLGLVLGGAAGAGATRVLLPSYHATRAAASDADQTMTWPWPCGLMAASGWPSGPRPGWPSASGSAAGADRPGPSSAGILGACRRRRDLRIRRGHPVPDRGDLSADGHPAMIPRLLGPPEPWHCASPPGPWESPIT